LTKSSNTPCFSTVFFSSFFDSSSAFALVAASSAFALAADSSALALASASSAFAF
jgi:hypothetical protein